MHQRFIREGDLLVGEELTVFPLPTLKHEDRKVANGPYAGRPVRLSFPSYLEALQRAFARGLGRALAEAVPAEWAALLEEVAPSVRIDPLMWATTGAFYKSGALMPEAESALERARLLKSDVETAQASVGGDGDAAAAGHIEDHIANLRSRLQPAGYQGHLERLTSRAKERDAAAARAATAPPANLASSTAQRARRSRTGCSTATMTLPCAFSSSRACAPEGDKTCRRRATFSSSTCPSRGRGLRESRGRGRLREGAPTGQPRCH